MYRKLHLKGTNFNYFKGRSLETARFLLAHIIKPKYPQVSLMQYIQGL